MLQEDDGAVEMDHAEEVLEGVLSSEHRATEVLEKGGRFSGNPRWSVLGVPRSPRVRFPSYMFACGLTKHWAAPD